MPSLGLLPSALCCLLPHPYFFFLPDTGKLVCLSVAHCHSLTVSAHLLLLTGLNPSSLWVWEPSRPLKRLFRAVW